MLLRSRRQRSATGPNPSAMAAPRRQRHIDRIAIRRHGQGSPAVDSDTIGRTGSSRRSQRNRRRSHAVWSVSTTKSMKPRTFAAGRCRDGYNAYSGNGSPSQPGNSSTRWPLSIALCWRSTPDRMFAITGTTGQVGHVARALLAAGQGVRAVVRDAAKARAWADRGCEVDVADMTDAAGLATAFRGCEGVFILLPPQFDLSPGFPESRAEAARRIAPVEVVATVARILGRPVRAEAVPRETWGQLVQVAEHEGSGPAHADARRIQRGLDRVRERRGGAAHGRGRARDRAAGLGRRAIRGFVGSVNLVGERVRHGALQDCAGWSIRPWCWDGSSTCSVAPRRLPMVRSRPGRRPARLAPRDR